MRVRPLLAREELKQIFMDFGDYITDTIEIKKNMKPAQQ